MVWIQVGSAVHRCKHSRVVKGSAITLLFTLSPYIWFTLFFMGVNNLYIIIWLAHIWEYQVSKYLLIYICLMLTHNVDPHLRPHSHPHPSPSPEYPPIPRGHTNRTNRNLPVLVLPPHPPTQTRRYGPDKSP